MNSKTPLVDRLLVIGTGFMGASLAAAAKSRGVARQVIGLDPQQAAVAKSLGHIDTVIDSFNALNKESGTLAVVIATPVHAIDGIFSGIDQLQARCPLLWATDIGSTKAGVIAAAQKHSLAWLGKFVSSHPMAGSEKQGAQHASPGLFEGARVLVSPLAQSAPEAVDQVESFWIGLGAQPSQLPIEDHDELLAAISHLPHVLAYSLAGALSQSPLAGAAQALHGGGLRDTTRIAASSPELWADIFLDNRECLMQAWSDWSLQMQSMHQAIEKSDRRLLVELLSQASHWRKGFQ